ncbi:hypothetical protein P3T18_004979 [Paraburkholderia sp. GAS199]|uniref:DUF6600 domain-containing protein n=1 Tax=Paraburkholderia sp. GAS199 TaxID=3035126 RepID=UPI003D19CE30
MRTVTRTQHSTRRVIGYTMIAAAAFMLSSQITLAQEAGMPPPGAVADNPQGGPQTSPNGDPPGRIARLNYTAGAVTTEPASATDWSYAQINRPLTTGDQLWNDQNARSELHIGSTALRLDQSTSLDILNLDDNTAQLKVVQGTLSARVRELPPGSSYEIDTPNLALGLNGPGDYRVDVAPDGSSTTVTVRSGSATVYGEAGQVPVAAGQQIRFAGTNLQQAADNGAPGLDGFDQWAASRDAAEDRSVSARYVSRDIPGYQDLDANGTWRSTPQYGEVWVPRATPAGWAPYHDGHWVWQAPWGWTWVDDAPWGFAPYHYGRWAQIDDSWAWVPGPVVVDQPPVYAPALVGFVGGGGGGGVDWGVSLAIGGAVAAGVAWFPLGPGEPWHPRWGGHDNWSPRYYDRVNRTTIVNNYNRNVTNVNVTNIHNTYVNYRPGAVTAVPATAFVHGQPTGRFAQKVDPRQWRNAQINPGGPGIAPVKESFSPGLRNANYRPPANAMTRPVVATRNPAMPAAYHDNLAQHFAQNGGRVPGAGAPIVRTSVPAHMAGAPGMPAQNVRVVQSHMAGRAPGMAPGAPNFAQQAGQRPGEAVPNGQPPRGGEPQARPGVPPQMANQRPQQGEAGRPGNGVPHPPQVNGAVGANGGNGGNPNAFAQQHGAPAQMGQPGQQAEANGRHEPAWTQPHTPMAQQRGGLQEQAGRPNYAQQPGAQPNAAMQQHGAPRPAENAAAEQARQQQRQPEAQAPRPQPMQPAQQAQPRQEFHPQPAQQAREEQRQQMQAQQQAQAQRQQMQAQQQAQAQRQQMQAQQQAQAQRQQMQAQQQRQEPRPQPQPQRVEQPRPQAQPQRAEQPRPQPQRAEQHSGGGNRDEHHRG